MNLIKKTNPKCPHCNVELETTDCYDVQYEDERVIYLQIGYCPECDRSFQWDEVYEYTETINLEET